MSRKFLETESPAWVAEGLITPEQQQRLLARYPADDHSVALLPLLGALLLGLGVLSYVAANWQSLPELLRLVLLLVALLGAYGGGLYALRRGQEPLGIGLLGLGLLTFGGSVILVGKMYHLVSYDARALLLWGAAGVALVWLTRSSFLFLLTLLILCGAQGYSADQFGVYSYVALALLALGLGSYWLRQPSRLTGWALALAWLAQMGLLVNTNHYPTLWLVPLMAVFYVVADFLPSRQLAYPVQLLPLAGALGLSLLATSTITLPWLQRELHAVGTTYWLALLVLAIASAAGKRQQKELSGMADWLLVLPVAALPVGAGVAAFGQLLVLYAYAGLVLWAGYREQWRVKVNAGTLLFIIATTAAYFRLTWEFLNKSLFFLLGGVLLLGLSWWLRRNNAQALKSNAQVLKGNS
jgi:uncharacterized membrane protein